MSNPLLSVVATIESHDIRVLKLVTNESHYVGTVAFGYIAGVASQLYAVIAQMQSKDSIEITFPEGRKKTFRRDCEKGEVTYHTVRAPLPIISGELVRRGWASAILYTPNVRLREKNDEGIIMSDNPRMGLLAHLEATYNFAMLPRWMNYFWDVGVHRGYITPMKAYGLESAWRVNLVADWDSVKTEGFVTNALSFKTGDSQ